MTGEAINGPNLNYPTLLSKPCYRCVSLMAGLGIKRVYWTGDNGEWLGAKVRDLMDALKCGPQPGGLASGEGEDTSLLFITKFEILKMRALEAVAPG